MSSYTTEQKLAGCYKTLLNGKPHGKGTWIEDCEEESYEGEWADGRVEEGR